MADHFNGLKEWEGVVCDRLSRLALTLSVIIIFVSECDQSGGQIKLLYSKECFIVLPLFSEKRRNFVKFKRQLIKGFFFFLL